MCEERVCMPTSVRYTAWSKVIPFDIKFIEIQHKHPTKQTHTHKKHPALFNPVQLHYIRNAFLSFKIDFICAKFITLLFIPLIYCGYYFYRFRFTFYRILKPFLFSSIIFVHLFTLLFGIVCDSQLIKIRVVYIKY